MGYIKKIKKETVEKTLGVEIEANKVSMGVDVAQKNTGIAIISTTESYIVVELTHVIKLPVLKKEDKNKVEVLLERVDLFCEQLDDFKQTIAQKYHLDENTIEDCFLSQNPSTFKTLARCGILVYDRFRHITAHSDLQLPSQWRKIIGFKPPKKKKLKLEVIDYIKKILEIEAELTEDEWEAVGISLSALVR